LKAKMKTNVKYLGKWYKRDEIVEVPEAVSNNWFSGGICVVHVEKPAVEEDDTQDDAASLTENLSPEQAEWVELMGTTSVAKMEEALYETNDQEAIKVLLDVETAGKDRASAKKVISERIELFGIGGGED